MASQASKRALGLRPAREGVKWQELLGKGELFHGEADYAQLCRLTGLPVH